ncbi:molybdopterin-guanine dinucleotide biosynthesis protein B [Methanosphaerula palustris]|uniref:Molybdopterin-guanine dinucleotide biosynthesis protein B n=1 Tax=Methanosphaerula palustris (strain ATCC BAA-1556 / DSM 19958 / E1-9c) TaxID=521011 RepID=B8GJ13_METPE|nr:molybdopterin-guanine dinucleotide biosynthesis protein B [Methanosphaerula palustris]ACL15586.1 molybdopterin-guanine dinucleotide biosynthesis protein B [Methanosphaerula palustris E1-9c]
MKIIQVIGRSNSGKTTFNQVLCTALQQKGTVAALKHLGHHTFKLEEGKDSTVLFQTGVKTAVGVDEEKAVMITRETALPELIRHLADMGTDYLVIEGFKTFSFPAVVIGELESDHCMLRNPTVEEVITALPGFPALYSISRLIGNGRTGPASGVIWIPPPTPGTIGSTPIEDRKDLILRTLEPLMNGICIRYQIPIKGIVPEQVLIATIAVNDSSSSCRLLVQATEMLDQAW